MTTPTKLDTAVHDTLAAWRYTQRQLELSDHYTRHEMVALTRANKALELAIGLLTGIRSGTYDYE